MKNKKGFTITEILVVIAIIGIILAISIPSIISIRKRSNERLLESKKDIILVAAELYAKDKNFQSTTRVKIYELVNNGYVNADVKQNQKNCKGSNTSKGCVINPVNNRSLNEKEILIKLSNDGYVAVWDNEQAMTGDVDLVNKVKEDLLCTDEMVDNMECVYCLNDSYCDNPDNYLLYSGVMWRVIGVYNIDGKHVAKMVTDDTVIWETNS